MEALPKIPAGEPAPAPAPSNPRRWLRDSVLACLGIKCFLLLLGVVVNEIRLDKPFPDLDKVLGVWVKWDSRHYFDIADHGYGPPGESITLAFPPLLPVLIREASRITGSLMSGGLLVSTILSFLPGLLLFQLARCDLGEENAFRAMLILLLFPTGFFLHIVYTEGLFLSLVLGTFLSARRGNWDAVAVLGMLSGLTRLNAFVLAPALLVEAWGASSRGRGLRILSALTVGVGIGGYLAINYFIAGDPFAFVGVQEHSFYRTFAWPWQGARAALIRAASDSPNAMMNGVLPSICIPLLLIACTASVVSQRLSYAIWMIGNTLVFTAQSRWISLPRLVLVLFPAFIWLAPRTARPVFGTLWFAASTLLMSFLAGQFAQGRWVS
jgi:Gpi18-like mannosyltransferase